MSTLVERESYYNELWMLNKHTVMLLPHIIPHCDICKLVMDFNLRYYYHRIIRIQYEYWDYSMKKEPLTIQISKSIIKSGEDALKEVIEALNPFKKTSSISHLVYSFRSRDGVETSFFQFRSCLNDTFTNGWQSLLIYAYC
jgi:hypothetical protein